MAQALFDDHPIELYLRESGEVPELMPGGIDEFERELTHANVPYEVTTLQWLPRLINTIQPVFEPIFAGFQGSTASSQFAERFKYIVISSALLSSSLSSSPINRIATPTTPGHYPILSPRSSAASPTVSNAGPHIPSYTCAVLIPLALMGYYLSCILLLAAMKFLSDGGLYYPTSLGFSNGEIPWTLTLDCLEGLIEANKMWDNVVSEALGILEVEDQSASSPSSSLPSLRIALSSSLRTTETQCDNVRQLLAALTSPLVLSQLSNMYAPPSPSRVSPSPKRSRPISLAPPSPVHSHTNPQARPLSLSIPPDDAYTRSRSGPVSQTSLAEKRSTWSGPYALVHGLSNRQLGRRPSHSAFIRVDDLESPPKIPTFSAPGASSHVLTPTSTIAAMETNVVNAGTEDEPFGVAALDLHRRRRSMRVSLLKAPCLPSDNTYTSSPDAPSHFHASHGPLLTSSFGSIFTSLSSAPATSRQTQHISLANLHLALQGALGSKRFACAHLLALRFSDYSNPQSQNQLGFDTGSEDESYWEDVRSVISLLTSTLEVASARLAEALADRVRRQEQESEIIIDEGSPLNSASCGAMQSNNTGALAPSFAPMPSHLARFAAHIDAIASALDDARDHLRECVASLSLEDDAEFTLRLPEDPESPPMALQYYERMRRELGFALRECERGRGTLMEIVKRSTSERPAEEGDEFSSGESDKTLYNSNEVHEPQKDDTHVDQGRQDRDPPVHVHVHDDNDDDATAHLIQTATSHHLPPPGIEQVFESVSAATQSFVRERSKLTREERIRVAKARRESRSRFSNSPLCSVEEPPDLHHREEKWGPGGEVVEELKDVIWQVSERRRKMIERLSPPPRSDPLLSQASPHIPLL